MDVNGCAGPYATGSGYRRAASRSHCRDHPHASSPYNFAAAVLQEMSMIGMASTLMRVACCAASSASGSVARGDSARTRLRSVLFILQRGRGTTACGRCVLARRVVVGAREQLAGAERVGGGFFCGFNLYLVSKSMTTCPPRGGARAPRARAAPRTRHTLLGGFKINSPRATALDCSPSTRVATSD